MEREQGTSIFAEKQAIAARIGELKKVRAVYGRQMQHINLTPKSERTVDDTATFLESERKLRIIDKELQPLRERYQVVMQEVAQITNQRKRERINERQLHNPPMPYLPPFSHITTREEVVTAFRLLIGDTPIDMHLFGQLLSRIESIALSSATAQLQVVHDAEIVNLRSQVASANYRAEQAQQEKQEQATRLIRNRNFIRAVWSAKVPATADDRARGYRYRVMVDEALAREWDDV